MERIQRENSGRIKDKEWFSWFCSERVSGRKKSSQQGTEIYPEADYFMMLTDPSQPPLRSTVKDLYQGNFEEGGEGSCLRQSLPVYMDCRVPGIILLSLFRNRQEKFFDWQCSNNNAYVLVK